MSVLITEVRDGRVTMLADTRETSFETGGARVLESGKIIKTTTTTGQDVLIGVVGNANHHGLLTYLTYQHKIAGDSHGELFTFFASFYEEADQRGSAVFASDGATYSEFHVAFSDHAYMVRGLTIEPITVNATSGSGADLAFGALVVGAPAIKAIKVACEFNAYCSFPVDVYESDDEGRFHRRRIKADGSEAPDKAPIPPPPTATTD